MMLHGFADASKLAYGAVIYCHTIDDRGDTRYSLVAAKSRLAPLKDITIPRLELCAALLLSELMYHYQTLLEEQRPLIRCWTDAEIVLCWIRRQANDLSVFVRNRVNKIIVHHPHEFWGYVPTGDNPADVISRGQFPESLVLNELWWSGPRQLNDRNAIKDHSVEELTANSSDCEITKRLLCNATTTSDETDLNVIVSRFSSLFRLKRIIARILKWINVVRKNSQREAEISYCQMRQGFVRVIRLLQMSAFPDEYEKCTGKEFVKKSSPLYHLSPYVDDNGLLRVGGRLMNANLSEVEKHPLIIPYGSLAALIVREIHISNLHCGVRQTIFLSRKYYWILKLNRLVKKEVSYCVKCLRFRGETYKTVMSPLPSFRVSEARAFYRTGVDYAGPFQIRAFRHRGNLTANGYVAVFVCLVTKAVHFELVTSLDMSSFIAAFERFVSRRGNCAEMWSDNGRNFVGSCAYLKKIYEQINQSNWCDEIKNAMAKRCVSWNFIPPYTPHFGGLWESAVKIMKGHLYKSMSGQVLTMEEMCTVLCRIEMVMNSRPLAPMSGDPDDCEVITPNHFLIGEGVSPLSLKEHNNDVSLRQRLRLVDDLTNGFWVRWRREYLKSVMMRTKWVTGQRKPVVGELVLLRHGLQPPGLWKMARIKRLIPGNDDEVRVVEVFDGNASRSEAVRNLVPLQLNADGSTGGGCSSDR